MIEYRYDDRPLGGETYRPSERPRSPPRGGYRGNRSPPRRGRTPPQYVDTYVRPPGRPRSRSPRRRSRSPDMRVRDDTGYRARQRSPPRNFSPRRENYGRASPPRPRRYSRSPAPVKRRELSPERRPRSPPYAKQERHPSPARDRFERRPLSPPRDRGPRYPQEQNYRPRERSRSPARRVEQLPRRDSPESSHRSTPHMHPDRIAMTGSGTVSPVYRGNRPPPARSPGYRDRSPPRRVYSPVPKSPPRTREPIPYRQRSPPPPRRRDSPPPYVKEEYRNGERPQHYSQPPPSAPINGGFANGDRGPPSGPGGYREPPNGPPSAPISMSAHSRLPSASLLSAPTRPRGGPGPYREREPSYSGPPSRGRGGYHSGPPPSPYRPPPPRHHEARPPYQDRGPPASTPAFRPNNSSSTTYPRTQRFNHPSLNSLPAIVPGGKAAPSGLDVSQEKRLQQIEDEKKKLMQVIEQKQAAKRKGLREWETGEREIKREGVKSAEAERGLEGLTEGTSAGAAF